MLALGQAGTQFKAPMRGLGVMKRGQMHRGRVSSRAGRDHFRDRAQNTSRPPSMHVDDFVKMAANPPSDSAQESRVGIIIHTNYSLQASDSAYCILKSITQYIP